MKQTEGFAKTYIWGTIGQKKSIRNWEALLQNSLVWRSWICSIFSKGKVVIDWGSWWVLSSVHTICLLVRRGWRTRHCKGREGKAVRMTREWKARRLWWTRKHNKFGDWWGIIFYFCLPHHWPIGRQSALHGDCSFSCSKSLGSGWAGVNFWPHSFFCSTI